MRTAQRPTASGDANKNGRSADAAADDQTLDTIRDMFGALRACSIPPPTDEARHGMEYTVRFAFKSDGEIIAPPRMTYSEPRRAGRGARSLPRRRRCGAKALHPAAFQ